MTGTGLLTQMCNAFGTAGDGDIRLAGGLFPASQVGQHIWYCQKRADGEYRMVCEGGDYGFRRQNDGGLINAFHCEGGHRGEPQPLCEEHATTLTAHAYEQARALRTPHHDRDGNERWWKDDFRLGGTRANMCPACLTGKGTRWHEEIRGRMETADRLHQELSRLQVGPVYMLPQVARIQSLLDQERAHLDELNERGIIHKCPLKLVEVS